eukprot:TRINITY_DN41792_c0_g1_i1.p1 TRINITY_DN41792_c0_g1~~TRINITY_DN41792_c0_g1_i1.p1  ORF type:complete len:304 (+),score=46.00 TRINITY_DN41792_c0_g1_i1:44-913(+)
MANDSSGVQGLKRSRDDDTVARQGRLIWLSGPPTAGKTWLGDFLAHYHGWLHVDGDADATRFSQGTDDESLNDRVTKSRRATKEFRDKRVEPPMELWRPYLEQLCADVGSAVLSNPERDVVVAYTVATAPMWRFVRSELLRLLHGRRITVVHLVLPMEESVSRGFKRVEGYCKSSSVTLAQAWQNMVEKGMVEIGSEPPSGDDPEAVARELFQRHFARRHEKWTFGTEPWSYAPPDTAEGDLEIDTSNGHCDVVPKIAELLRLEPVKSVDADLVSKVNYDRLASFKKNR